MCKGQEYGSAVWESSHKSQVSRYLWWTRMYVTRMYEYKDVYAYSSINIIIKKVLSSVDWVLFVETVKVIWYVDVLTVCW